MKCKTHFSVCLGTIVLTLIISFQLKAPLKTLTELEGSFFYSSFMDSWISMDYRDVQVVIKKKKKASLISEHLHLLYRSPHLYRKFLKVPHIKKA